jgi:2-C-methyl-D-erythritol 2,4-cyclodiphosphate synthase
MMRVGLGYDLHRLVEGRPLILGGVKIEYTRGLAGHSDADVLTHAIIDALLGAAAIGNIGEHFPDTDPVYRNIDSLKLLEATKAMLAGKGYKIINIDANIIAQEPKLAPYLDAMREKIAHVLGIETDQVSVKAKTNEKAGPEGREEAISAQAVVLIEQ